MDINKLKEKRQEINRELSAILERNTSGVMGKEDKERFAHLESESTEIKATIERSEKVTAENAELSKFKTVLPANVKLDLSQSDINRYSIVRAIRARLDNKAIDGLEGELNTEIARQCGLSARGFYVPTNSLLFGGPSGQNREISRGFTATTGSAVVTQEWQGYVDYLRNKSILAMTGATFLNNLQGLVNIPIKSAVTTAYWVTEGNGPTAGNPTMNTGLQLSPKTVGATVDLTRSLVQQTSYDVEMMVRNDIVGSVAKAIDYTAVCGSSGAANPIGIMYTPSIPTYSIAADAGAGGLLAWSDLVGMESTVAAANADVDNLAYVFNAKTRGILKQTAKIGSTYPNFLWEPDNTVNGYKAFVSNQLPSNLSKSSSGAVLSAGVFGNWNDLVIGMYGSLDVTIDPYSLSTSGGLRLVALQSCDVAIRHLGSFVIANAIKTS